MSNLLDPIHGVSLYDYAVVCAKTASGVSQEEILKALGVEPAIYEEVSALWIARMQEDSTWEVTTKFGEYFTMVDSHPKLSNLKAEVSETGMDNLERLKADRYFYEELCGARSAAYEYGMDGAQWILDNFGVNLGDFQSISMQWMSHRNEETNEETLKYSHYMDSKMKEYATKFAAEQGGNVADDVEF